MNADGMGSGRAFAIISGITAVLGGGLVLISNLSGIVPDPHLHEDWTLLLLVAVGLFAGLKLYAWTPVWDAGMLLFDWGVGAVLAGLYIFMGDADWEVLYILIPVYASIFYLTGRHVVWRYRQRH